MGVGDELAKALGIVLGGIGANLFKGFNEFHSVQKLFQKTEDSSCMENIKTLIKGTFASIEGLWFSLPTTIAGVNSVPNMNDLVKIGLFTPAFLSSSIDEASNIYSTLPQRYINDNNSETSYIIPAIQKKHTLQKVEEYQNPLKFDIKREEEQPNLQSEEKIQHQQSFNSIIVVEYHPSQTGENVNIIGDNNSEESDV